MIVSKKNLLFLRLALLFSVVGSGMTWTGLGYELARTYDNPGLMGLLQVISTSAGLAGPMLIAFFSLKMSSKSILILSDIISATCYIALFFVFLNPTLSLLSLVLMVTLVFTSMSVGAIQAVYFEPLYASCIEIHNSDKLSQEFARLGTYMTFGKLLGMGVGPVMFGMFHYFPLLFNAFTFIVSASLFYLGLKGLNFNKSGDQENSTKDSKGRLILNFRLLTNFTFLEGAVASSLIFVVVLFLSLKMLSLEATALQMSLFWTSATLSALISQLIISRSKMLFNFMSELDVKVGYLFTVPVLVSIFFDKIWLIIICQIIFSFLNPIARNKARAHFFQVFGDNKQNNQSSYAMRDLISQLILLIVGISLSLQINFTLNALVVICLIFFRWFFANSRFSYAKAT